MVVSFTCEANDLQESLVLELTDSARVGGSSVKA